MVEEPPEGIVWALLALSARERGVRRNLGSRLQAQPSPAPGIVVVDVQPSIRPMRRVRDTAVERRERTGRNRWDGHVGEHAPTPRNCWAAPATSTQGHDESNLEPRGSAWCHFHPREVERERGRGRGVVPGVLADQLEIACRGRPRSWRADLGTSSLHRVAIAPATALRRTGVQPPPAPSRPPMDPPADATPTTNRANPGN